MFARVTRLFFLLAALFALSPAAAQTGAWQETGHARSRLLARDASLQPGTTQWIALHQELEEGWHVYWSNPGDSGLPLAIDWSLPDGFEAGEPIYPLPHRLPIDPLVNFGHEGAPVFLVPLAVPEGAAGEVSIEASASWLICLDICVPEASRLTLTLPVVDAPPSPGPQSALLDAALSARAEPAPFAASYFDAGEGPVISLGERLRDPELFPLVPNLIEPSGSHVVSFEDGATRLSTEPGFAYLDGAPEIIEAVVVAGPEDARRGFAISAQRTDVPAGYQAPDTSAPAADASAAPGGTPGLTLILLFSLAGGLILNVMPCVFPIVFLKATTLARTAHEDRAVVRRDGLLYTAGVLATFAALAGALIALRAGGEQLGWGFQLQSPITVGVFAVVLFLIGLNLAGLFEVGTSLQGVGQGLAGRGGGLGAFLTGALAVFVAAPCIGPFLGVPVGYALSQNAAVALLVFLTVGLGLALPYLALSLAPVLARLLPKPGAWMVTFKQVMSFAMFAVVVWLAWVLSLQAGPSGVLALGTALVLAGIAAWAFGRGQGGGAVWRGVAAVALILALVPILRTEPAPPAALAGDDGTGLPAVKFSDSSLQELRAAGTPVFVDFTAAWCVTCQVNKQAVLTRAPVVRAFREADAAYMVADWTVQDPAITAALERHGRSGVPLYLWYAPGEDAVILPQVLSVGGVLDLFERLQREGERTS